MRRAYRADVPAPPAPLAADERRRRQLRDVRRLARRYRRWLGAGLVGLALLLALTALTPPAQPTVGVAVAARDLAAGTLLRSADIATLQLPTTVAPATAVTSSSLVGEVLASPVAAGEHLTASRLGGGALLIGTPPGTVALPVRVADPGAASLVSPGDRVDLLAAVTTEAGTLVRTVGRDVAVVLAGGSMQPASAGGIGPLAVADGGADLLGGLLVVAASPSQVTSIVAGAAESPLHLAVRPPQ